MYSISQALEDIIMSKPYLSELLEHELLNITQLARQLKPEVEDRCMKESTVEAIAMAIRRFPKKPTPEKVSELFSKTPDIMVRSQLCEITVKKQNNIKQIHTILKQSTLIEGQFFTITLGIFEDTIIFSEDQKERIVALFKRGDILSEFDDLAAITIRLPPASVDTPGVYYYVLKSLFLENTNIIEVVSTYLELTLLVEEKDAEHTFATVKQLFKSP